MANNTPPSIEHLPVELFHSIFDQLDAQTILFSVRPVCRLFRSVVKSYDRYKFDAKIICKCKFHCLCRLIPPQHLISLTLHHSERIPDQISFFISNYRLRQLARLHSLNLFGIDEAQLNFIFKRINLNLLTSFSLHIEKHDDRRKKTTQHYLSLIMAQPNLRKVELNIREDRISDIQWPSHSRIESLTINNEIIIHDLITILSCSPQLRQLILKETTLYRTDTIPKASFTQLTSLTLEDCNMSTNELQSFLLLTSALIHLKVIGEDCIDDGKQWEEFIQANLPHLKKLEFFINFWRFVDLSREYLESMLESFRSPFWIEHKKWFVVGEIYPNESHQFQIYSIPICKSTFQYKLNSRRCFLSISNDISITENINELNLLLEHSINNDTLQRMNISFPNVTKLSIDLPEKISIDFLKYLPSIINISQLIQIELKSYYFAKDNKDILFGMIKLIERSSKLSSLIIHREYSKDDLYVYLNDLCSILPHQINYLQIPINQLEQIEIILERCPYLSVIKFEITGTKFSAEVVQWFQENTIDSVFKKHIEESLTINNEVTIDELIPIISCSPQLHRLILNSMALDINDSTIPRSLFSQLTSLTFEELNMSIDELECFLLLTPLLTHLKLIGEGDLCDGKRWEEFIQANLLYLNKFEFFISCWRIDDQTREYLESIIESFRSPFWIEHKKWFVAGEFYLKQKNPIRIYSLPSCKSIDEYEFDSGKCFYSTLNNDFSPNYFGTMLRFPSGEI